MPGFLAIFIRHLAWIQRRFILIFNRKLSFARIEVFYMKIIMRRVSEIFHSGNPRNDNAVRRCLLDKIE